MAANVHSFAVGGAIVLRRPRRRVLNCDTKDKILFKSLIDKCQLVQKLNSITGDDQRFASPPAATKLHVGRSLIVKLAILRTKIKFHFNRMLLLQSVTFVIVA